jgi:hypothetical protein
MGIFRPKNPGQPRYSGKLHNLQFTESIFGTCVPIVFGTPRVHGKLLFYGGFNAQKSKNSAGKGIFGGKATQFIYYADNLQCLGQGSGSDHCRGIINVWDQNGRMANQNSNYNYLIASPYTVQPSTNPVISADLGVYQPGVVITMPTDNYGSGNASSTVVNVTQNAVFKHVPGGPQGPQQYTFDPSSGTYSFHASDAGKTVTIIYNTVFSLYYEATTQAADIPTSTIPPQISTDNQQYFYKDNGVVYVQTGQPLIRDSDDSSSEPSQPGHYNVKTGPISDTSPGGFYTFNRADAGQFVFIFYEYTSSDAELTNSSNLNLTFFGGTLSQAPWSYCISKYPGQVLGYNGICYVGFNPMYLGGSALVQPYNYELGGLCMFGGGNLDAHPLDCIFSILTDPLLGVGFPIQNLDSCLPSTADFSDGQPHNWAGSTNPTSIVSVTGQGSFSGALKVSSRDNNTAFNTAVTPGQRIFVSGWLNSQGLAGHPSDSNTWKLGIGMFGKNSSGAVVSYLMTSRLQIPSGQDWTYVWDYITIPSGVASVDGWVQVDGPVSTSPYFSLAAMPTFSTMMPNSWQDAYNYWAASNYLISKSIDTQSSVSEIFDELVKVGNVGPVWSGGILKMIPYGDTSITNNGYVYVPPFTTGNPPPTLTWDDLLTDSRPGEKTSTDPIEVTQKAPQDCLNYVQCQFMNRLNDYNNELIPEQNDAFIATYGFRPESSQSWDFITTHQTAAWALNLRLKRNLYIRNTYKFKLSFYWSQLEPMDMLVLPTGEPIRITQITDDSEGKLEIEAEQWSYGTGNATIYPKQQPTSFLPIYSQALPGNTSPVIFEATPQSVLAKPNCLQIAVAGESDQWGGCEIFVSQDGNEYVPVDNMDSLGRVGTISNIMGIGVDPDTVSTLAVDMTISEAQLVTVTQAQADQFASLCVLTNTSGDVELVSYETATETAVDRYNLTYLRRGVYGTTMGNWYVGDFFSYLGISGVFEYQYPAQYVGKTVWFKFASYNMAHLQQQDLANCKAYPYIIQGTSLQPPSGGTFHTQPPVVLSAQATTGIPSVVSLVGNVTAYTYNDSPHSGPVGAYIWKNPGDVGTGTPRTTSGALGTITGSSLMFDTGGLGTSIGPSNPVNWTTLDNTGAVTGTTPLFPAGQPESAGYSDFNVCVIATLSIPAPGTYNFTIQYKDQVMLGVGGGATVSTGYQTGVFGQTKSVISNLPLVFVGTLDGSGHGHTSVISLTFSAAGNYDIELDWVYWFHSGRTACLYLGSSTNIPPEPTSGGTQGQITVANFTALLNNQSVACVPTPSVIQNLTRGASYYVYYIDKAFAGGNIVPYVTQNVNDFLNITGYHQLLGQNVDGSVTIPTSTTTMFLTKAPPGAAPGNAPKLHGVQYQILGSTTPITPPHYAADGNLVNACVIRGYVDDNNEVYVCEIDFFGFDIGVSGGETLSYDSVLYIDCSASGPLAGGNGSIEVFVGKKGVTTIIINTAGPRTVGTVQIPSGTDLSSVIVKAIAIGVVGQDPVEIKIYSMYIQ